MNYLLKTKFLFIITLFFAYASSSYAVSSASELQVKVYKVAISLSPYCTNPVTVFEDANPSYTDLLTSPTLGSGSVPDGTYACVMIEMDDVIKFKPTANDGANCTGGTLYERDVCASNSSASGQLINGTAFTCSGDGTSGHSGAHQRIAIYLSTASTSNNGSATNAFTPVVSGSEGTKGFKLNGALEVSSTTSAKFVVNAANKVDGSSSPCDMQPPLWGFQKI